MDELLKVEHLAVSFQTDAGELEAVRDVSFTLRPGEVLAIVGESVSMIRIFLRVKKKKCKSCGDGCLQWYFRIR